MPKGKAGCFLSALGTFGDGIEAVVSYVDDNTGNVISRQWNSLDKSTQARLLGAGKVATVALPASAVSKFKTAINKPSNLPHIQKIANQITHRQNLINGLREQINAPGFKAKNLRLTLNGKEHYPIPELSKRAAVYSGVSDKEIFQLFQDLAGISKMPNPVDKIKKDGVKQGIYYAVQDRHGNRFTLRNFSDSQEITKAKWTIDINSQKAEQGHNLINRNQFEIKFQQLIGEQNVR
ncbi:hypothetical protein EV693_102225 [Nicoletella semolina]|uniref:Uncharacterized protein n=1 Tax=Nicoletella semolina TaxID=271160 RepID=A0A4R2NBY7_9PAST|nr:hypothetical protein [Nicoletella semolina]MDH2924996.1 hypothetical protein [Nicoletella semolina]TCP18545.1 hypothetical protein EV693_102225 [Nicoletella semolina]